MMKLVLTTSIIFCCACNTAIHAVEKTLSDYFPEWEILSTEGVEGGVAFTNIIDRQMRNVDFVSVFQSLSTNNYTLIKNEKFISAYIDFLQVEIAEYKVDDDSELSFIIQYVTSSDKNIGGLIGLVDLTRFYSNRNGKLFQQYADGPGDICLVDTFDINNIATNPTTVDSLFFSRDNVAVRIRSYNNPHDILAFAKLVDTCILSSSIKELE